MQHIFAITNPGLQQMWEQYRSCLVEKGVDSYFYDTTLVCDIAHEMVLCQNSSCGVCGIANQGFSANFVGNDMRGTGYSFYFTGKNDFSHGSTNQKGVYHAVILCDVCPRRKYTSNETQMSLQSPPPGFDSVYGQVGERDKYSEIVVYNSAAIIPRYIINIVPTGLTNYIMRNQFLVHKRTCGVKSLMKWFYLHIIILMMHGEVKKNNAVTEQKSLKKKAGYHSYRETSRCEGAVKIFRCTEF